MTLQSNVFLEAGRGKQQWHREREMRTLWGWERFGRQANGRHCRCWKTNGSSGDQESTPSWFILSEKVQLALWCSFPVISPESWCGVGVWSSIANRPVCHLGYLTCKDGQLRRRANSWGTARRLLNAGAETVAGKTLSRHISRDPAQVLCGTVTHLVHTQKMNNMQTKKKKRIKDKGKVLKDYF